MRIDGGDWSLLTKSISASNSLINACRFSLSVTVSRLAGLTFDELSPCCRGVCVSPLSGSLVSSLPPVCAPNCLPLSLASHHDPALNHPPYIFSPVSANIGCRQSLASCLSLPQLKHNPTNHSYWKVICTLTPSGLSIGAPLCIGLSKGNSTRIRRKRA